VFWVGIHRYLHGASLCMFGLVHRSYCVGRQAYTTNPAACEIISLIEKCSGGGGGGGGKK
jgi:hypothetical protein